MGRAATKNKFMRICFCQLGYSDILDTTSLQWLDKKGADLQKAEIQNEFENILNFEKLKADVGIPTQAVEQRCAAEA